MFNVKNRPLRAMLVLSLAMNIVFFALLVYAKRDVVRQKISEVLGAVKGDPSTDVERMNRTGLPVVFEDVINPTGDVTLRLLVIGNSIAYHPAAPNLGWLHASGMAATTPEGDYVHVLAAMLGETRKARVEYRVINLADFERNFRSYDVSGNPSLTNFSPDLVVFQLGENVSLQSEKDAADFCNHYAQLVGLFKGALRVLALPFFASAEKNAIVESVAAVTGSATVDLSHLGVLDKKNFARTEGHYSDGGVGLHPGNQGMANIANAIFPTASALLDTRGIAVPVTR